MKAILLRLLALAACLPGGGLAASGCTSLYATTVTGATARLEFVNTLTGNVTPVFTLPGSVSSINGMALNPVTGAVYYLDRTEPANTLYMYNAQTGVNSLVGAVPLPTTGAVTVGATFDNSTGTPRLFVLYNTYQVQEITLGTTPTVARMLSINFTGSGLNRTSAAISGTTTTSGDILFIDGNLYATLDAQTGTAGSVYYVKLGVPPTSGATGTLTVSSPVQLRNAGASFAVKSVNGIAINGADGATYISHTSGDDFIARLNPMTGAVTNFPTTGNSPTDLSDCNNVPDRPTITKSFSPNVVTITQGSRVTLTVGNTNPSPYYLQSALTDTLPTGVTVADVPTVTTTCTASSGTAAVVTAAAGSGSVTLPAGTRVPGGGCTLSFNVKANSSGSKINTIAAGGVASTAGTNTAPGSATLTVDAKVTGTLQKTQRNVTQGGAAATTEVNGRPGDVMEYCITATHPGAGTADATVASVRDTLAGTLVALPGVYAGKDVRLTKGSVVTDLTFASDSDAAALAGQTLTVNILPWGSSNTTARVCFQAQVR